MTDLFTFKPRDPYFGSTVALKAAEFDRENPAIYELFIKFTMELWYAGHKRFEAKAIIERIRWHVAVETKGEDFKICNSHTAYYARKAMQDYDFLAGFFETRSASE